MRRLAGLFGEHETLAGQAMPKPFKLAAYVDHTGDAQKLPPALVNVLFAAFGVTALSAYIAPSVLRSSGDVGEHIQPSALPQPRGNPIPAGFVDPSALATVPDGDRHPALKPGRVERRSAVAPATGGPGISPLATRPLATSGTIPAPDLATQRTSDGIFGSGRSGSRPRVSTTTDFTGEPARFAAVALRPPTADIARSDTPVRAIEVSPEAGSADSRDDTVVRDGPLQSAGAIAAARGVDGEPSAGIQPGSGERNVGLSDPVTPRQTSRGVEFEVGTSFNGVAGGRIALLLEDSMLGKPDRVSENISVRLGDIINLLAPRMDPGVLAWLTSSDHVEQYLTLNDLRAHGISVSFDAKDRLVFRAM